MAFSDIIKKLADSSEVLSQTEKDELYIEARNLEKAASLFNGMVIPGTSSLQVDGLTANRAQIVDAEIQSATAGGGDVMIDGEGVWIRNQQAAFGFEDTSSQRFNIFLFSDGNDNLGLINEIPGRGIRMLNTMTNGVAPNLYYKENPITPNLNQFSIEPGTAGTLFSLGSDVLIYADNDGHETVFNDLGHNTDFRVESDTNDKAIFLDASAEAVSFFGNPSTPTTLLTLDNGVEKRFEFGGDHYIPIRSSSNPNIYFNEANQDMDFHIESVNDMHAFWLDAGLDSIGMGGGGESGTKLNVTGDIRLSANLKIGAAGSDVQAYVSGSKFVLKYLDGATTRYKYLDMAGTGVTWVHTTVAP